MAVGTTLCKCTPRVYKKRRVRTLAGIREDNLSLLSEDTGTTFS